MNEHGTHKTLIDRLVWVFISLYIFFFGCINFLKYQSFEYRDFDLAGHIQSIWNILHGSLYCSILDVAFLGNHACFIWFLIAPIYFVFRHPLTLLFLQTLFLGMAAYPLYLIAKDQVNKSVACVISVVYLLYPALWYINLYEVHPSAFAVPFLLYMFYYFQKNKFKKFVICMILALLCQENFVLLIVPFGIYALFLKKGTKWAAVPLFVGVAWFLIVIGVIMPYFNKGTMEFIDIYSHLGNSLPEVALFIITHPLRVTRLLVSGQRIEYLIQLFAPISFFCLFDARILIASLAFLQHLLSNRPNEYMLQYHYAADMLPFIFISVVYGLRRILSLSFFKKELHRKLLLIFMVFVAIFSNIFLVTRPLIYNRAQFKKSAEDFQKERLLDKVPDDAGIVATFEFLPRLAHRKKLYSFHHVVMGVHTMSDKPFYLPNDIEYALIDFEDRFTFNYFYSLGGAERRLKKFFTENNWGILDMVNNMVLLRKNYSNNNQLFEVLTTMPPSAQTTKAVANDELVFLGHQLLSKKEIASGMQMKLALYWSALKRLHKDYRTVIDIADRQGKSLDYFIQPLCYRIYPTYEWQPGEVIREVYTVFIPRTIKENFQFLRIGVYDQVNQIASAHPFISTSSDGLLTEGMIVIDMRDIEKKE